MQVVVLHFDRSKEVTDSGQSEPISPNFPRFIRQTPTAYDKSFATENTRVLEHFMHKIGARAEIGATCRITGW